ARCVRAPRHGLALARNRGLAEADGAIVAFTDDDALPDRAWLAQLAKAFEVAPDVACVTGLVLPAELESDAQVWVDAMWGFGKGFERRVFDRHRPPGALLYPYTAGVFGSGANMAFRTGALRDMGGFDPALGAGSPATRGAAARARPPRAARDGRRPVRLPAQPLAAPRAVRARGAGLMAALETPPAARAAARASSGPLALLDLRMGLHELAELLAARAA